MIRLRTLAAALLCLAFAPHALASVTRIGASQLVVAGPARGAPAVAYDSVNHVYLVVTGHSQVRGRFVGTDGVPIGTEFVIQSTGGYAHFPRVAFSPHGNSGRGAFLVTWHESVPNPIVHARMVSYVGGPLGTAIPLTSEVSFWETGPAVAYSTASQLFLVVWENIGHNRIRSALVNNAGALVASFNAGEGGYVAKPTVTYNSASNEFLVAYVGAAVAATVDAQRVSPAGTLIGAPIPITATTGTYQVDASYSASTNQYLVAWVQNPGSASQGSYGRLVNADGGHAGNITPLSLRFFSHDSLSIAYNNLSASFLLVAQDSLGPDDGGVEVSSAGVPIGSELFMTATGNPGNYFPRLGANSEAPEWLVSSAYNFTSTYVHRLVGTGGGAPPPPPPPVSNPRMSLDVPGAGATVSTPFALAGWALDLGAPSGTGVAAVHVWAFPTSGASPIFVGAANLGVSRPDVGAHFGDQRFSASGFGLSGTLAPGTYNIRVSALSTVANAFSIEAWTRVTVAAPLSIPAMWVDLPAQNQTVSQNIAIAGWAVDLGSSSGTGVDAVHVWAYPVGGGNPLFVGAATVGHFRPDVAAFYGHPRFGAAGYFLQGNLPPGRYYLVVFAHSAVTGTFNQSALIVITVV